MNVCVSFQIHKHRALIQQILGYMLPTSCVCFGMQQEGNEEKVLSLESSMSWAAGQLSHLLGVGPYVR